MSSIKSIFSLFFLIIGPFLQHAFAEVKTLQIKGTINPATARYLDRVLRAVDPHTTQAVLIELDTPGGLLSSLRDMAQGMSESKAPVIVYVSPSGASATSAGALLALSAHVAVMAPGTNMGAAHPVGAQGEEIKGPMADKATNDTAAFARSMAELHGRDPKIASEIVTKSLSFSAEEALRAGLIDFIAETRGNIWERVNGKKIIVGQNQRTLAFESPPVVEAIEMTLGERVLDILSHPNIAAILISLGVLLIYAELSSPGIGFAGIGGVLALLVAFIAFQAVPIREGGLVLIFMGAGLMVAEVFFTTHGAFLVGGALSFVLGLLWVVDPKQTDLRIDPQLIFSIGVILFLAAGFFVWAAGRTRILRKIALAQMGGGDALGLKGYEGKVQTVSSDGRNGKVEVRGEIWEFESQFPLEIGDRVQMKDHKGMRLIVESRAKVKKGE